MPLEPDDPDFVNALARGLAVITSFGQHAEVQTLSDVAAKTGLTRGTARRFLLTLEALGYVRSDGKSFRLAPKTLNLGYAYLSSLPLWKAAQPIMKDLVETLNEFVRVRRARRARRCLYRAPSAEASVLHPGQSRHAHAGSHQRHGPGAVGATSVPRSSTITSGTRSSKKSRDIPRRAKARFEKPWPAWPKTDMHCRISSCSLGYSPLPCRYRSGRDGLKSR